MDIFGTEGETEGHCGFHCLTDCESGVKQRVPCTALEIEQASCEFSDFCLSCCPEVMLPRLMLTLELSK